MNTTIDLTTELKLKGFKAYPISSELEEFHYYRRKEFYKICVITSDNIIHYADRTFHTTGPILFFGNPHIPYSWKVVSEKFDGYCCLFSEDFINTREQTVDLAKSSFFKFGGTPVLNLNLEQRELVHALFDKILTESETEYSFRDKLIRNYIDLIILEARKMQPSTDYSSRTNAAERITSVFFELLERQFPIKAIDQPLELTSPQDYAGGLSVHVNYLNRCLKKVTGKTTSDLIAERVVSEAKSLLLHTDWNSSDISYALGFQYPSYFNNFFKKFTGTNPRSIRLKKAVIT